MQIRRSSTLAHLQLTRLIEHHQRKPSLRCHAIYTTEASQTRDVHGRAGQRPARVCLPCVGSYFVCSHRPAPLGVQSIEGGFGQCWENIMVLSTQLSVRILHVMQERFCK